MNMSIAKELLLQNPTLYEEQIASDEVAILLCTFRGQEYLREQLESFESQSHSNWKVYASDDGSDDETKCILESYQKRWEPNKLVIFEGPSTGFVSNFLFLSCDIPIVSEFLAFADQDDIWMPHKLERALSILRDVPQNTPAVYGSRTQAICASGKHLGFSPIFEKPPTFRNALTQNIAGGNTMVFNRAARSLLRNAGSKVNVVTHDWWLYILVSGAGGRVVYDQTPTVRYRQHRNNLIGFNGTWRARFKRLKLLLTGLFREWNTKNIIAIEASCHRLTPDNEFAFSCFKRARDSTLLTRLYLLKKSGVYRQTFLGNAGLVVAAVLKKL